MGRRNSAVPFTIHYQLKFREPAHYLRGCGRAIHHTALINQNRRAFGAVRQFDEGLTGQETFAVNGAGGDLTDDLAFGIRHRVPVMRHALALVNGWNVYNSHADIIIQLLQTSLRVPCPNCTAGTRERIGARAQPIQSDIPVVPEGH